MVGSLFLTMALAWLTSCDGTQTPEPAAEAVYLVGNDAVPTIPAVDVCEPDDEMCSGEPTEAPAKPKRFVTVEFRVLHTPSKLVGNIGNDIFLNSNQVQTFLRRVHNDPHAEILVSPRMILCSGQEGTISIGSCAPKAASCETPLPIGQKVANWPGVPDGEEFGVEPRAKKAGSLDGLTLKAMPRVSADGRYVEVILEGTTSFCPSGQCAGANQVSTARLHGCCPDGNTIFLRNGCCPPQPCIGVPVLSGLPFIGELFRMNGEEPENVVMMATVHVVDQAGQPVAPTSCTRDCQSCQPPDVCPNPQSPATVENNLEHLQRAKQLYELALLYERLNQVDVANKILCNIWELCPHSQIALQAQSEYSRGQRNIWFTDEPLPLGVPVFSADSGGCQLPTCPQAGAYNPKMAVPAPRQAYVIEPPDLLTVQLSKALPNCPLTGQRLVRADGTIDLGSYGSVCVAGLSVEQARDRVEQYLSKTIRNPKVRLDVYAYNSKGYYVIAGGAGFGEQAVRLPYTGNETVLDAIAQIGGLPPTSSKTRIWLARPGTGVMPINWNTIVQCGNPSTNYCMQPNDRIYISSDPTIQAAIAVGRTQKTTGGEEADAGAHSAKLDRILSGYRQACEEGNADRARQLAIEALAIDPTCFAK